MFRIADITETIPDMTKFGLFQYLQEKWTDGGVNKDIIETLKKKGGFKEERALMPLVFKMNVLNVY